MANSQRKGYSLRIGADLVEISKIRGIFSREGFQETVFTPAELGHSQRHRSPMTDLAVRFAVKEALFKALGTGLSGEMDWRDVEVSSRIAENPRLRISGRTAQVAQEAGVSDCAFSFSYTEELAVALVVLALHGPNRESVGSRQVQP